MAFILPSAWLPQASYTSSLKLSETTPLIYMSEIEERISKSKSKSGNRKSKSEKSQIEERKVDLMGRRITNFSMTFHVWQWKSTIVQLKFHGLVGTVAHWGHFLDHFRKSNISQSIISVQWPVGAIY